MLILALVVAGEAGLFVAGKRHILHSRCRMTTGELGKYFLDRLQMDVRQDQWNPPSNCLSGDLTRCPTAQSIDNITYTPTYGIDGVSGTSLRRATVTITWNEPQP